MGGANAKHAGSNVAFLVLGGIAAVGLIFFWLLMPETRDKAEEDSEEKSQTESSKEKAA